ncbi:MAG: TadE family protein [Candidatus Dormibacteria bacterium]
MLEFALSIGVLGALLMGSLSLGRYAYDRMVVREVVEESAKLAMVDRPHDGQAWQMSNAELLDWQRAAANDIDHTIQPGDIDHVDGPDPWKYTDKPLNAPGANGPQGFISQVVDKVNGLLDDAHLPVKVSKAGFTRAFNPGAETMRVMFKYNPGLSVGGTINSEIDFSFTRYQMFTMPFSPEEDGSFPGSSH